MKLKQEHKKSVSKNSNCFDVNDAFIFSIYSQVLNVTTAELLTINDDAGLFMHFCLFVSFLSKTLRLYLNCFLKFSVLA